MEELLLPAAALPVALPEGFGAGASSSSSSIVAAPAAEGGGGGRDSAGDEAAGGSDGLGLDGDIDALCQLISARVPSSREGSEAEAGEGDLDELLGALAPSSPLAQRLSPRLSPSAMPLDGLGADTDLPEPTLALPAEVATSVKGFSMIAKFNLRCEVDLRQVTFRVRHAEFNPRKHSSVTIRLIEPRVTALVRASGSCTVAGTVDEDALKLSAKKVVRLIQLSGHEEVRFSGYKVVCMMAKASMGFPIRLDQLAAKWRRNALYEPEVYCGCVFKTMRPRVTYLLTAGGKVMISGLTNMKDINEAVKRIHPILSEFRS
mmetsp:Transcript_39615/g.126991  ORF Transcript_39615/g.126991 Transcript_39615/m.126991 type:complete len:318 (-) Transcript_39615:52-1005(-)|eukprot:CAMPEP_0203866806 /NCGR_PEP_ID=MMETSP0359-20131031/16161_1 /ASSEMBLY_ACC=CAM_ASM_000338 /TAXON_ID=268821 /ORGANISM="Scrippsiella Hangoei, Strain SHTV-5" /LENGTH=317 /DNA_ID=CAMNT_0050784963 /DNA_START=56 /DNA_END=1009 /DNA_ORIENTATION=-